MIAPRRIEIAPARAADPHTVRVPEAMTKQTSPRSPTQGGGDPWAAFGYLVAGVGFYGFLGWGLGVWLHASYLTPVGILFGATLALGLVFHQYGRGPRAGSDQDRTTTTPRAAVPPPDKPTDDGGGAE